MSLIYPLSRLRWRAVIAGYLRESPQVILLSLGLYATLTLPSSWLGRWPSILFITFIAIRLVGPLYQWYARRYEFSLRHLTERSGVFRIRTRSLAWSDVTAVEVSVPWSHRALGLSIVTVKTDGGPDTTVRLDGVDRHMTDEIRVMARGLSAERPAPVQHVDQHDTNRTRASVVPGVESPELVYRSSAADLLAASLFYGQFVVLAGVFVGGMIQFAELFRIAPVVLGVAGDNPAIAVTALVVVGSAVGCGLTVVKFHEFSVWHDAQNVIIEHGLFDKRQRTVRREDIIGIQLRRNIVELLFDRVRVSIISTDSSQQLGANLVLPSLPAGRVEKILTPLFPRYREPLLRSGRDRYGILGVAAVTLVPLWVVISMVLAVRAWTDLTWFLEIPLAVVFAVLSYAAASLVVARFDFTRIAEGEIRWSTLMWAQRTWIVNLDAIHVATAWALGRKNPNSYQIFRLHFFAGRPKVLAAVVPEDQGTRAAVRAAYCYAEEISSSRMKNRGIS